MDSSKETTIRGNDPIDRAVPTVARSRTLGRGVRNSLLTAHIMVSVGLFGDSAGFLAVAVRRSTSDDPALVASAHQVLRMFALVFGIPSASRPFSPASLSG